MKNKKNIKMSNKLVEPINYPTGNLLAHFKRYRTIFINLKFKQTLRLL